MLSIFASIHDPDESDHITGLLENHKSNQESLRHEIVGTT